MTEELPAMPSDDGAGRGDSETDGWRRLHPLTILKEIGSLAWAIVAALVLDFQPADVPGIWEEADVAIAVAVFVYALARYFFTAYRVTPTSLELRRGVFVKSLQVMPRDRVQSVGANAGFIGRLFGVTTVEVSAADAEDIQLGFVSEEDAEALRRVLERGATGSGDGEGEEATAAEVVAMLPLSRLLLFGVTDTALLVGAVAVVAGLAIGVATRQYWIPLPVLGALAWPTIRAFGLVGFRSTIEQDRLRVQAGILGRRHTESPLERIQLVQVRRPPLRRMFGYETVTMVTGDIGVSAENMNLTGFVAPLVPIGQWKVVAERLLGPVALDEEDLARSSRLTIRRAVLRGLVAVAVVAAAVGWIGWAFARAAWVGALVAAAGTVAAVAYARARWRILGWALDDRHLMLRRGVFDRRLTIVPVHKVQDVTIRATPFQRRLGLATVDVDTAGLSLSGSVLAVDLPVEQARYLADRLAETAARVALPDGV